MSFWIGLNHAANYRGELSLDAKKAFQEGSGSFDASSLIRGISFEIMPIFGIETEAIMVVISLNPHLLAQLNCILVAKEGKLSSPLQHNHHAFHWPSAWAFSTLDDLNLQLAGKALKMTTLLQYQLHLQIVLQQWIVVI